MQAMLARGLQIRFLGRMLFLLWLPGLVLGVLAVGFALRLLYPLPMAEQTELPPARNGLRESRLQLALGDLAARYPGLSGILPLVDGHGALTARILLLRAAQHSIDVQYYIWKGDVSGRLLLEEIWKAAERGVRVRLLLDDNGTWGLDQDLARLDAHRGIEVRLFNPFTVRWPKVIGYAMDPLRLNRRMHNKSLIVDNVATIVGGRNIGDEYFGIGENSQFADLDILAVGQIVPDVTADFERYWQARASYPLTGLLAASLGHGRQAKPEPGHRVRLLSDHEAALQESPLAFIQEGRLPEFDWVRVQMVSDDPAKALGKVQKGGQLIDQLFPLMGHPRTSLALISPYFVPTALGTKQLVALAQSGVRVSVLTNALDSTSHALVHAAYSKHRRRLLEGGVRLFELKGDRKADLSAGTSTKGSMSRPAIRSGPTSLHAKTFSVDRGMAFVGSFNFDPRSALLNTELGFVIESEPLANGVQNLLDDGVAGIAYEVRLDAKRMYWIEQTANGQQLHRREPHTGPLQRMILVVLAHLPIDWLL